MSFCVAGVALCDIPTCFIRCRECQRMSKWAEVSHDMLVLLRPRVSSRVSGFPVASPCLWGKLQNLSFSKVSKQVVMSFLRGRRCTLWHSNLFDNVPRVSKLAEVSHDMLVLLRPRVSSRVSGFPVASPCLYMGEAAKPVLFEGFQAGCHVVLHGSSSTLWHSNLFDNVPRVSKLAEVSHDMLVLLRPRVSSRVSGFPVASPCLLLWFSKVSKQVVMSFCVAGVALCDIPTCLIPRCSPRTRMLTRMLMVQMSKHMHMQSRRTLFCNSG